MKPSHPDDRRGVTRKDALRLLAGSAVTLLAGLPAAARADPVCTVRPQQTEGPYFTDDDLHRADIRSDPSDGSLRPGARLELTLRVSRGSAAACAPVEGMLVDVWHCDHTGTYSDVSDRRFQTRGRRFLRGHQFTGGDGRARFTTIVPGWYPGRAAHIHFKLRDTPGTGRGSEFTSQLYFDETLLDELYTRAPYNERSDRRTRSDTDRIFNRQGGSRLLLPLQPDDDGWAAEFDVTLET